MQNYINYACGIVSLLFHVILEQREYPGTVHNLDRVQSYWYRLDY